MIDMTERKESFCVVSYLQLVLFPPVNDNMDEMTRRKKDEKDQRLK
jgi:hypothetical protein